MHRSLSIMIILVVLATAFTTANVQAQPLHSPTAPGGTTTRVSASSDGSQGNDLSERASISADGNYVVFNSSATNLVNGDTNDVLDIFVHKPTTGETFRVTVASDGTQANGETEASSISGNGRYVTFATGANNLVEEDTNNYQDIFVHDCETEQTTRVSVSSDGTQANNYSEHPTISADGRFVAFTSQASNLVIGDTNGISDVYVHDLTTGETTLVSVASDGTQGDGSSNLPSISTDGRYVAFVSLATNLVSEGTIGHHQHIYVHDRTTGQTTLESVASDGTEANFDSAEPSISADGHYVAFWSLADNLVSGDTFMTADVFVHDRTTGQTTIVSIASDGTKGNGPSDMPSISANGRFVAFISSASNLVIGDTYGEDVFVHDLVTGQTTRVSLASDGTQGNGNSYAPSISADGHYISFDSWASNLTSGDTKWNYGCFCSR